MDCKRCGAPVQKNTRFCVKCGAPVVRRSGCLIAVLVAAGVCLLLTVAIFVPAVIGALASVDGSVATPAPTIAKEEFKSMCVEFDFDAAARTPEDYNGTMVVFAGEVLQAMNGGRGDLRVALLDADGYADYDRVVYVTSHVKDGDGRILDGDKVKVYGTSDGIRTYETVMGGAESIPLVRGAYIGIDKQ